MAGYRQEYEVLRSLEAMRNREMNAQALGPSGRRAFKLGWEAAVKYILRNGEENGETEYVSTQIHPN